MKVPIVTHKILAKIIACLRDIQMNDHIIINTIIIQKKRKLIFYLDTELSSIFAYSNMQPTDLINI